MGRLGNSLVLPRRIVVVLSFCRAQWLCWGPQLLFESVTQEVWVQFPILLWVSQGFGMSLPWQCLRLRGLEKVEEFLSAVFGELEHSTCCCNANNFIRKIISKSW